MENGMATLRQFLQNGELGAIRPGMTRAEVIAVLRQPQDESVTRHPQILKYGSLQLTFVRQPGHEELVLVQIGLYFHPCSEAIPAPVQLTDFHPTGETTLAEVREVLTSLGLEEASAVEGEDTSYLIMPSGARITFDGQKMHSISFAAPRPVRARKQVSLSVSTNTWSQLTALARQANRSVGDLCSEWITQRADELAAQQNRQIA
jgi:hypothetical protein